MHECPWYKVDHFIEAIHRELTPDEQYRFDPAINACLLEEGIGWQLTEGQIVTRGTEAFEAVVTDAVDALNATNRPTAARHVHDALLALSRRPEC